PVQRTFPALPRRHVSRRSGAADVPNLAKRLHLLWCEIEVDRHFVFSIPLSSKIKGPLTQPKRIVNFGPVGGPGRPCRGKRLAGCHFTESHLPIDPALESGVLPKLSA